MTTLSSRLLLCRYWILLVTPYFLGCSGQTQHPVEGQVSVDGTSMDSGTVMLFPDGAKGNTTTGQPSGKVVSGKYSVMHQGHTGAPPGWYKVAVIPEEKVDSTKPFEGKSKVAARFRQSAQTPLAFEVVAGPAAGAYDLKVSAK